ncbi:MAG TPA: hypothetical protein VLP30_03300 [Desulfatirhabdiaceae bacterium]|nr:hypothetical protein [Desulfatirhabdiaceae bacterium]
MSEIRMTGEIRTDYDCETSGLPAERWAEAVFKIGEEEIIFEVSVEKSVIVAIMVGEDTGWKGTLEGLKQMLKGEIKGPKRDKS